MELNAVINSKPITRIREHEVVVYPKTEYKEDAKNDGNNRLRL